MDGIVIKGTESHLPLSLWPDTKTGIVLLATQYADLFFGGPSIEGSNMVAVVVKSPAPGQEHKGLRVLTLTPMGGFSRPEEKDAWGVFFAAMLAEKDSMAGFQAFEGRVTTFEQESVTAFREDSWVQMIFTQDGLLQVRDTRFSRNAEGVAVPRRPVQVTDGDGVTLEGRMTGRKDEQD